MKRRKAITSKQLRRRIKRYRRFVAEMEQQLTSQTSIHDLVPTLGTRDPGVYVNPHFKLWISRNGQRSRALNHITSCDYQLLQNHLNSVPEGVTPEAFTSAFCD